MAPHERLLGRYRDYEKFEDRPVHPVTGIKADYLWELPDGSTEPRWNDAYPKCADPTRTWYSVKEVAVTTGRHPNTVRLALKSGALKGSRPRVDAGRGPGRWMISGQAVTDWVTGGTDPTILPAQVTEAS